MSQKPTLVFIPGAWHSATIWDQTASFLETQQYKCVRVELPTTAPNPSASFFDDLEATRSAILAETTQGRDVVVVVHSYGGMVGNSAIKGLTRPKKDASSPANEPSGGHVIGLIMMASGFTATGVSFLGGFGDKPPPIWKLDEETGFVVLLIDPRELFYHDLPVDEGNYWVGKLKQQSIISLTEGGEHAYSGWMDVPVWYLATTEDKALPFEAQKMFIGMVQGAGGNITMREIAASHSPMLSKPKESAEFIVEAVTAFVG